MDIGNIYSDFRSGEEWQQVPFIAVPIQASDKQIIYVPGVDLLTKISQKYYGTPVMGKYILAANPEIINEFDVDEETLLRVPFPLESSLELFREAIDDYLNG